MSRRLTALALGLVALSASPVVAGASHSDGERPMKNTVRGTGHFEGLNPGSGLPTDATLHVSARSGPSGENPKGHFFVNRAAPTELRIRGKVTCLNVVRNQAVVGGRIEGGQALDLAFPIGGGVLFQFDDNGEGRVISDMMQGSPTSTPTVCPNPVRPARLTVQQGNFVVHDHTP